jgi:hypothetical protein
LTRSSDIVIVSGLLLISLIVLLFPVRAWPPAQNGAGKLVMLIVDQVNYDDLWRYGGPNLRRLLGNGALGLMNTNSGGDYTDCGSYITIGAGNYAVCPQKSVSVAPQLKSGDGGRGEIGGVVNQGLENLLQANEEVRRTVKVGQLGASLSQGGVKRAVIGAEGGLAEGDLVPARAALITMSDRGQTDYGLVDSRVLEPNCDLPGGVGTDYKALAAAYDQIFPDADFIVIQTGDSYRLNKGAEEGVVEEEKAKALIFENMDPFLGKVMESLGEEALLLFTVPFPSRNDIAAGKKLTPLVAYGPSVPKGLLSSATTKRRGIVTNTDLTAEVLKFFGAGPSLALTGHELVYEPHQHPEEMIGRLQQVTAFNYRHRPLLVTGWASSMITMLLLYGLTANNYPRFRAYLEPGLIAGMMLPTVLLILPLFNCWHWPGFLGLALALTLGLGLLAAFSCPTFRYLGLALLTSVALIVVDTVINNPLLKTSILSYDPTVGARFYGIGNEYMGFLLGATLMGTATLLEHYRLNRLRAQLVSTVILTVVLAIIALPNLGTNVGGAMAAFLGFGTFFLQLFRGRIKKKDLAGLGLGLMVFLLLLFLLDGGRSPEQQSHIGQFFTLVRQRPAEMVEVAKRKLALNYRLLKHSIWSRILAAVTVVLAAAFCWPLGVWEQTQDRYQYLSYAAKAGIVATAAALIFNDSGVVAAGTCILPVGISLLVTATGRQ